LLPINQFNAGLKNRLIVADTCVRKTSGHKDVRRKEVLKRKQNKAENHQANFTSASIRLVAVDQQPHMVINSEKKNSLW